MMLSLLVRVGLAETRFRVRMLNQVGALDAYSTIQEDTISLLREGSTRFNYEITQDKSPYPPFFAPVTFHIRTVFG